LFERSLPVAEKKSCDEAWEVEATRKINDKVMAIQREFSSKSEMSQSKAAGFHFSC
jgi:hypothetical protein